ncbi:hypothetical protein PFTANZ_06111 [Plasmodium falciparum Tanzania (2000708)]|uniref:Surface antigen n=1 Tax=Plasmodium falciparum Tanzania (2000708) TaxID=1036725 RepID=A0A024VXI7_PLAFA|nr:hypothetical protein PFTANZ_06111 [Plasmodium falciparum Tanzania (2000708)]
MQQFDERISERFHEYDERIQEKRKKCKEQCEKDIQKIILKDKIEKELTEKLDALQTDIQSDELPECTCEKSLADKVEKTCLKCGRNLGGVVAPSLGVLGGIAELAISKWKPGALLAAESDAIAEGTAAGIKAGEVEGIKYIIGELRNQLQIYSIGPSPLEKAITAKTLYNPTLLTESVNIQHNILCKISGYNENEALCVIVGEESSSPKSVIGIYTQDIMSNAKEAVAQATKATTEQITPAFIESNKNAVEAACFTYHTAIIASIVAILIIVLIMFVIYLILRYRRTKKMKKKLQYIKLLKE